MRQPGRPLDPSIIPQQSVRERQARLRADDLAAPLHADQTLFDFLASLPKTGAARTILEAAHALSDAAQRRRATIALIGEPLVVSGYSPQVTQLIERGLLAAVGLDGGAALADFELACYGQTDEDPATPRYGAAREVGDTFNQVVNEGVNRGFGLGEYLGRMLLERAPRHLDVSMLARASAKRVPATVHPLIGAEPAHRHPAADGARLGKGAQKDFLLLAGQMAEPNGGGIILDFWSDGLKGVFDQAMLAAWQAVDGPMGPWTIVSFDSPGVAPRARPVPAPEVGVAHVAGDPALFSLFALAALSHPVA